jgi:hypothetical protein
MFRNKGTKRKLKESFGGVKAGRGLDGKESWKGRTRKGKNDREGKVKMAGKERMSNIGIEKGREKVGIALDPYDDQQKLYCCTVQKKWPPC